MNFIGSKRHTFEQCIDVYSISSAIVQYRKSEVYSQLFPLWEFQDIARKYHICTERVGNSLTCSEGECLTCEEPRRNFFSIRVALKPDLSMRSTHVRSIGMIYTTLVACSIVSMLQRFYQDSESQQGTRLINQRAFNRIVIKWSYCTNSALSNHQTYRVVVEVFWQTWRLWLRYTLLHI